MANISVELSIILCSAKRVITGLSTPLCVRVLLYRGSNRAGVWTDCPKASLVLLRWKSPPGITCLGPVSTQISDGVLKPDTRIAWSRRHNVRVILRARVTRHSDIVGGGSGPRPP